VHPFGDLSAYLDEALSPEARASVQAHLDACALCRTRLAELRGTARLIAALPMPMAVTVAVGPHVPRVTFLMVDRMTAVTVARVLVNFQCRRPQWDPRYPAAASF